jgi:hypothetical protein
MRKSLLRLLFIALCFPALSHASVLVYSGTFIETLLADTVNVTRTKNIFLAVETSPLAPGAYAVVWFKEGGEKRTEYYDFYGPKFIQVGPPLSSRTIIYDESRLIDGEGHFYSDTRVFGGRNVEVVLHKSSHLLATVPKVLTGTESFVTDAVDKFYRTRRFRLQLDIKATQEAYVTTHTPFVIREAFLEKLKERGYPQPGPP